MVPRQAWWLGHFHVLVVCVVAKLLPSGGCRKRAEARTLQRCLGAFNAVVGHRGNQLSRLGLALAAAFEAVHVGFSGSSAPAAPFSAAAAAVWEVAVASVAHGTRQLFHH